MTQNFVDWKNLSLLPLEHYKLYFMSMLNNRVQSSQIVYYFNTKHSFNFTIFTIVEKNIHTTIKQTLAGKSQGVSVWIKEIVWRN